MIDAVRPCLHKSCSMLLIIGLLGYHNELLVYRCNIYNSINSYVIDTHLIQYTYQVVIRTGSIRFDEDGSLVFFTKLATPSQVIHLLFLVYDNITYAVIGFEGSYLYIRRIIRIAAYALVVINPVVFTQQYGHSRAFLDLGFVLRFYLLLIFVRHVYLHCLWFRHGSGKHEEGNKQKAKVHHRRQVDTRRHLLAFLDPGAFLMSSTGGHIHFSHGTMLFLVN